MRAKLLLHKMLEQMDGVGPCNVIDDLPFANITLQAERVTFQVSALLLVLFKSYLDQLCEEKRESTTTQVNNHVNDWRSTCMSNTSFTCCWSIPGDCLLRRFSQTLKTDYKGDGEGEGGSTGSKPKLP